MNILIVDDSSAMRAIIAKTLRISGLEITKILHAKHGEEALDILGENWVDLALVDINMPVMDGETLINKIRESEDLAELPIIVVSTESRELKIVKLLSKGVEFIHKPFGPETVHSVVQELLGVGNGV